MSTITQQDKFAGAKAHLRSLFDLYENTLNGQKEQPIHRIRKTAIDRLAGLDFPTRKDENWKYTSVNRLLEPSYVEGKSVAVSAEDIHPYTYGIDAHRLVFVNGVYNEQLSTIKELPEGVVIEEVSKALSMDAYRDMVHQQLAEWASQADNPFVVLNAAFAKHGVLVHVPKNTVVERPFHLLNIIAPNEAEPMMINPQSIVFAEQSSSVTLMESYHQLPGYQGVSFSNTVNRFVMGPNAQAQMIKLQRHSEEGYQINITSVDQERDSKFSSFAIDLGGKLVRNNLNIHLKGQNTETNMYGTYLAGNRQHIDNQTYIDHAIPHCYSNELYKGIITDRAKGVFNGQVIVRKDAQKTNAFQQNSTLVLSENATMDTKPQLEIYADDVSCSHGATIGQLDESAVYYLRTRGLSVEQARSLLQQAFLREVIENIEIEPVRDIIDGWIIEKFENQDLGG